MNDNTRDVSNYVDKYLKLRDLKKQLDDEHKKRVAPITEAMEQLEGLFLSHLQTTGGSSAGFKGIGTIYKSMRVSASIADGAAFRQFVIDNSSWDMLDWKANANAVDTFLQENATLPPGVNLSRAVTVNVRRATGRSE